ncbi:unnamed protein product [Bursaphelenchus okinawaensis]|uniref:Uncharacterized protein n=1 Tax=Bursaphelenchus okinawaensis TaxID=465554 RepID=A0A811K085_9BILA|nr:unnamed protein product [Bursaphelenchus okinawaensis]CAG9088749.1 unnamed protein product [Bursaphelenchus okinawaensis]
MEFDASFLLKILVANALQKRDGKVICAKFVSFKHNAQDTSVTRSITPVCPHYSNSPTTKAFKYDRTDVADLHYVFSLKDIDNLYAYGKNKNNAFYAFNFNHDKPFYNFFETEKKYWMVGNVVLLQGDNPTLYFFNGKGLVPMNNNVNLFYEKVVGSTETGDLWLRKDKCKKLEAKEDNYNLVDYDCKDPEQLLLSLSALKEIGANLNKDEASANDFAILYYEQASATIPPTTTTLITTTETEAPSDDIDLFTTSTCHLGERQILLPNLHQLPHGVFGDWPYLIGAIVACVVIFAAVIYCTFKSKINRMCRNMKIHWNESKESRSKKLALHKLQKKLKGSRKDKNGKTQKKTSNNSQDGNSTPKKAEKLRLSGNSQDNASISSNSHSAVEPQNQEEENVPTTRASTPSVPNQAADFPTGREKTEPGTSKQGTARPGTSSQKTQAETSQKEQASRGESRKQETSAAESQDQVAPQMGTPKSKRNMPEKSKKNK